MSSWKECKLGDVIDIKHGYAFKGENITTEKTEDILVTPGNFNIGGGFKSSKFKYFNGTYPEDYIFNQGDIIVTMTDLSKEGDTLGYSAKIPKSDNCKYLHNQRVGLVKFISSDVNKDFIHWLMRTREYQAFIVGSATGTSIRHTSPKLIKEYQFELPPLEEQKAIAEVLSSLDDKIDLLHRQNQTLELLAQTLFRQWFIEEAKEEWEEVLITDLFEVRDGTHDSPKQKEFGKKLLTSKHILKNKLDFESSYFISEEDFEKINQRSIVEQGDILFSMIGTIGLTYLEQSNEIDYAIKNIGLFKTSQNKKFMYFVYLWLNSSFGVEFIHENRSGSTQEYISLGSLRNIIFNLPNYEIIDLFNEKIEPIFEKINTNIKQIKSLENLRDTLLPKLLSGEVRVEI